MPATLSGSSQLPPSRPQLAVRTDARARHGAVAVCHGQIWIAQHDGSIVIRSGKTGEELTKVPKAGDGTFASCIVQVMEAVWVGYTDGVLREFSASAAGAETVPMAELDLNQGSGGDEVLSLTAEESSAYVGTLGGQVVKVTCGLQRDDTLRPHGPPVTALATFGPALWVGDRQGCVAREREGAPVCALTSEVVQITPVWRSGTVWAAGRDGTVAVLDARGEGTPAVLAVLPAQGAGRPCCVRPVGASVLTCGGDGRLLVWNARERDFTRVGKGRRQGLLAVHEGWHGEGGVRHLCVAASAETARVWSVGADGMMRRAEVKAAEEEPHWGEGACVAFLQHWNDTLRIDFEDLAQKERLLRAELAEKQAEASKERRATEAERWKLSEVRGELESLRLEFNEAKRERDNMHRDCDATRRGKDESILDVTKLQEQVRKLRADMLKKDEELEAAAARVKQSRGEQEKMQVRLDGAEADKKKLTERVTQLTGAVAQEKEQSRKAREAEAQQKRAAADSDKRGTSNAEDLKKERAAVEKLRADLAGSAKDLEAAGQANAALEQRLRDARKETIDLRLQLEQTQLALKRMEQLAANESLDAGRLADTAILARHEADTLRKERDELVGKVHTEREYVDDRDDLVSRLRGQLEVAREELGEERQSRRQLEDQYTIFQFVIASRGELVTSIWNLHDLLKRVRNAVKAHGDFSREHLQALRSNVREQGTKLMDAVRDTVGHVDEKARYIIANYFTEYEKLHLGIPSYHFYPDSKRPPVVGDELLQRLRSVTPAKLFSSDAGMGRVRSPSGLSLSVDNTLSPRRAAAAAAARSPVLLRASSPLPPRSPSRI
eukprot:Hpha_TRINITY_DN2428_c0_g1::TRINITY_DN2428_c0_g1_i1::g.24590::m.24590